jgi:2-deoxy-scyllo-inosamine dehydrogenase (SAM-dependent)/8-amino-3,8-dideoxy-alpha-D-manno-octulosonate transaminase
MKGLSPISNKRTIPLFERLQIESQSLCNRSCWFCPRTYDQSGKYLDQEGRAVANKMPTETILDLLDQACALGFQGQVGFHHYSEPLLDPRNIFLAQEARKRGIKPYLHTNGDQFKRDDELCKAATRVYDRIIIGLYDYKTNEELERSKQYWRQKLDGYNLELSPIGLEGAVSAHSLGTPKALVPSDQRMAVPDFTFSNAPCHRPLIRLIIQHDGEIANCCEDTYGVFKLGNVYHHTLEELWYSDNHVQVVQDLLAGRRENFSLCRNCPLPPTGPPPAGLKIQISPRHNPYPF